MAGKRSARRKASHTGRKGRKKRRPEEEEEPSGGTMMGMRSGFKKVAGTAKSKDSADSKAKKTDFLSIITYAALAGAIVYLISRFTC